MFTLSAALFLVPCVQRSYRLVTERYHKFNQLVTKEHLNFTEDYFMLNYAFATLNVEQKIESLDFDLGALLSAAGGNMGLFLGLSVSSLALAFIQCCKSLAFKKVWSNRAENSNVGMRNYFLRMMTKCQQVGTKLTFKDKPDSKGIVC